MNSEFSTQYRMLLRELFWTRTGIFLLGMAGIGTLLLAVSTIPRSMAWSGVLFSVGSGLVASVVFTAAQTILTIPASNRVLIDAVVTQTSSAMRQLSAEYRQSNALYQPSHIFERSVRPDPAFNRQLMADRN